MVAAFRLPFAHTCRLLLSDTDSSPVLGALPHSTSPRPLSMHPPCPHPPPSLPALPARIASPARPSLAHEILPATPHYHAPGSARSGVPSARPPPPPPPFEPADSCRLLFLSGCASLDRSQLRSSLWKLSPPQARSPACTCTPRSVPARSYVKSTLPARQPASVLPRLTDSACGLRSPRARVDDRMFTNVPAFAPTALCPPRPLRLRPPMRSNTHHRPSAILP